MWEERCVTALRPARRGSLPGFPARQAILDAVTLPPFEECRTVIFRRG